MERKNHSIEETDDPKMNLKIKLISWIISGVLYFFTVVAIIVLYTNMGWEDNMHYPIIILLSSIVGNIIVQLFIRGYKKKP